MKFGHKIYPEDIAGMVGLPSVGNIWYVDGTNGSDSASGTSATDAFKTVSFAHSAATANQNDVIIVIAGGSATGGAVNESAKVTWSKSFTHLIGCAAPNEVAGRARIVDNSSAGVSPFFTISGNGCIFSNVQIGEFKASGTINVSLTGDRCYFGGVHFAGIGEAATAGASTSARSLVLTDADENLFENCIIGLDTIARSAANCELEFASQSQRNVFRDCKFLTYSSAGTNFFVKVGAGGVDRWNSFENCAFINPIDSAATTMTEAMTIDAAPGGSTIISGAGTYKLGTTGWADTVATLRMVGISSNATYANGIGFAVNPQT